MVKEPRELPCFLIRRGIYESIILHGLWNGVTISPEQIEEWSVMVKSMIKGLGSHTIPEILMKYGIAVCHCASCYEFPEFIFRADIDCRSRIITLYKPMLLELAAALAHCSVFLPPSLNLEEIILAHELYHFLAADESCHPVEAALGREIKAHLFCTFLLELPFYPWVLDSAHLAYRFPKRVEENINKIID
jgi:hypothetical protein